MHGNNNTANAYSREHDYYQFMITSFNSILSIYVQNVSAITLKENFPYLKLQ